MSGSVLASINVLAIKRRRKGDRQGWVTVPNAYLQRVVDLSVDEKEDHATEIIWKVTFVEGAGPGELDDPYFREHDEVQLVFGWLGRMSRPHEGSIVAIDGPELSSSGAACNVIKMHDGSTKLSGHSTRRSIGGKIVDILLDICTRRGLQPYLPTSQGVIRAVSKLSTDFPAWLKQHHVEHQAHQSDRQVLRNIGKRCNATVRVEGDKLHFEQRDYGKGAKRAYAWRDGSGVLQAFKPASKTTGKNAGKGLETTAHAVDKDKQQEQKHTANDTTEAGRTVLGKGKVYDIKAADGTEWQADTTGHVVVPQEPARAQDHAASAFKHAESTPIQATAEIVLDPTLERGDIIQIQNVGQKNSGNYKIVELKHAISASGSPKSSLGLHRHGNSKAKDKLNAKVNTTKPTAPLKKAVVKVRVVDGAEETVND